MKIAIVGDSPQVPSGFGVQTDLLSRGLAKRGHQIYCLNPIPARSDPPENITDVFVDIRDPHALDLAIYRLKTDATIMFSSTFMVAHFARGRAAQARGPVFYWFPWEARTLPPNANSLLLNTPDNSVVHLSEFAQDLWKEFFKVSTVIPHCVDLALFSRKELDKKTLRRKWSKKLKYPIYDDTFLIINTDRNIRHKRWDATFSYLKQLVNRFTNREICLIANTKKNEGHFHYNIYGYDLEKASKCYGIEENLVFTDFDWGSKSFTREELVELLSICDLRISTTSGEGFGIPAIECAALEVPQLVNGCPPLNELLPAELLVEPSFYEWDRDSLWSVPDIPKFVDRTIQLIQNPESLDQTLQDAKQYVAANFSKEVVVDQWETLIKLEVEDTKNHWISGRWGHTSKTINYMCFRDLALIVKLINPKSSVLDFGSFTGEFVQFCLDLGLNIKGLEADKAAYDASSEVVKISCVNDDFINGLTKVGTYSTVVITDLVDLLLNVNYNPPDIEHLFSMVLKASVDWLFIRNNPSFYPNGEVKNLDFVDGSLTSCGFTRRQDIETVIKSKDNYKNFTHEIWTRDPSVFPKALTTI